MCYTKTSNEFNASNLHYNGNRAFFPYLLSLRIFKNCTFTPGDIHHLTLHTNIFFKRSYCKFTHVSMMPHARTAVLNFFNTVSFCSDVTSLYSACNFMQTTDRKDIVLRKTFTS